MGVAGIMPWVALGEEGVSVLPVTGARRAAALHRAAREVSAVAVHHGAVVGVTEVVEVPVVAAVAVAAVDAGNRFGIDD